MQESQETQMSSHLDGIVGAVSVRSRKKISKQLTQTSLFQPAREKLHLCEENAKSYSSRHEYQQAIRELVRCVALTRICYGDPHWKLAEAHVNLAQGYLQLRGLSLQAKQHAEQAREILTNAIMPPYSDDLDVFKCSIELFHTLGRALFSIQKFKEAAENLTKAERLLKELLQCGRILKDEWIEIQAPAASRGPHLTAAAFRGDLLHGVFLFTAQVLFLANKNFSHCGRKASFHTFQTPMQERGPGASHRPGVRLVRFIGAIKLWRKPDPTGRS
uniref:Tetratricopeptide repeat domain 23 n=1 Tax=Rousettus aegyptiacus TaxID=9407 RepID=A0A7J8CML5_ROUAE|nr:tetratricopeptide repeat domain 23 [Rousettus aegyptiacus]